MANNALLQRIAAGAQPRIADAMFRGAQQGNALMEFQREQQKQNALAEMAQAYAQGGPEAAMRVAGQLGQFPQAVALGQQGYQRGRDTVADAAAQARAALPTSSLGKLTSDFKRGLISPEVYRAKIGAIGKGGVNVYTGDIPLAKKTEGKTQADVVAGRAALSNIQNIRRLYKDSNFLTTVGEADRALTRKADRLGVTKDTPFVGGLVSDERKKNLQERKKFQVAVEQEFNRYRKEITGAAAAIQELESLRKATFNTDLGPTEFNASLDQLESSIRRIDQLRIKLLSQGIDPRTPKGGAQLDAMMLVDNGEIATPPSGSVQINGYTIEEIPQNG